MSQPEPVQSALPYGEGFAALYASERYAVFSRHLAGLALELIQSFGAPGTDLLDLACGAAAGTAVFAAAGFDTTGADRSAAMLRQARCRATQHGLEMRLLQQDMQALQVPAPVGAVTCLFDALNYLLEEEELSATFEGVAAALRPGGLFVFDMNTAAGLARRWAPQTSVRTVRRAAIELDDYEVDAALGLHTVRTTTLVRHANGAAFTRYEEVHRERAYPLMVISALLARAGLGVEASYSLYDRFRGPAGLQPFSDEAGRMMLVARRRATALPEELQETA